MEEAEQEFYFDEYYQPEIKRENQLLRERTEETLCSTRRWPFKWQRSKSRLGEAQEDRIRTPPGKDKLLTLKHPLSKKSSRLASAHQLDRSRKPQKHKLSSLSSQHSERANSLRRQSDVHFCL